MTEPHERGRSPEPFSVQHTPISARVPEDVGRGVFCNATTILQSHDEFVVDFLATMVQPQQIVARVILTPTTFSQLISALRDNLKLYESHFGRLTARDAPAPPLSPPAAAEPGAPAAPGVAAPEAPPAASSPAPAPAAGGASAGGGASDAGPAAEPPAPREAAPREPVPRETSGSTQQRVEDLYDQLKLPDKLLAGVFANVVMIRHLGEEFCLDFVANFYPRPVVTARVFLAAGRVPSFLDAMTNSFGMYRQRFGGPTPPQAPPAS